MTERKLLLVLRRKYNELLVYPPLARAAGVAGDVELRIDVRQDGSVQSADVWSGHTLLRQVALDNTEPLK